MNAKKWKLYRKLTKLTYASGIVFLLVGMVLTAVSQPVLASSNDQQTDPTPADPGSKDPGLGVEPNPGEGPGVGQPPDEGETPDDGQIPDTGAPPVEGKPPVNIEVPEKGNAPDKGKPPVRNEKQDTGNTLRKNISGVSGASIANPLQINSGKSSLAFIGGCTGDSCTSVNIQVCNLGDSDMSNSVEWQLYYSPDDDPREGNIVISGNVGPLAQGECDSLTYKPNGVSGNYMFRTEQESGGSGSTEMWSSGCTIDVCKKAPLAVQADVEGSIEFTTSDSAICQYDEGLIPATVRVSLPEGVTARLQTQWYIVNPPGSRTSPVYEIHEVSNGDEVTFEALWPGVNPGDEVVEIHWGARLSFPENGIDTQLDVTGLDYYWYPWVCGPQETPTPVPFENLSISAVCGFSDAQQIQWKVSNPNSYAVNYTWEVEGGGESGSGTADPGDSYFTTDPGVKTVQLYANNELNGSATSTDACKEDISVTYSCTENGVLFTANNPNDFVIELNFELDGVSGSATLPANSSSSVAVASSGAHTLTYNWSDGVESRSGSVSSPSDACQEENPEPGKLSLSYLCVVDGLNWTVTNPNDFAVTFNWEQVGGASGTETVGANSSLTFFKSALGTSILNLNYVIENVQLSNSLTNGDDYCQVIPTSTPTPVTPTSTPVTTTSTPVTRTATPVIRTSTPGSEIGDPGSTPTPVATLAPPSLSAADAVLIPVTGADLTTQGKIDFLKNLMVNLGLVFLGLAFVFHGITNKFGPF